MHARHGADGPAAAGSPRRDGTDKERDNLERIRNASRRLNRVFLTTFWAAPALVALFWICMDLLPPAELARMLPTGVRLPLPVSARIMGFVVSMIPVGVTMYGLRTLAALFALYARGEIFGAGCVHRYRLLARTLLWWFAASLVSGSLMSLALTLHNPPGRRMISLGVGSPDLTALLVGAVLWVLARVMEEARALQEEQDLTV
ncbi:MAG: DUF2975 domain-containing protein [Desulfovibrionaceae bacterium]|jgi:hypothetical protein|nr:DUF2975 domain-containing protein [Desulfovibrionaceae bacterium]